MGNKLTIAVALAAGLTGGLLTRYIAPPPVFAQSPATPVTDEVRAKSFVLVAAGGRVIGTFTSVADKSGMGPGHVVLNDSNGREIWSVGGSMMRPLVAGPR